MAGITKKRPRCPNGTRKNTKTGKCEPKKGMNTNTTMEASKKKRTYKFKRAAKPGPKEKKQKKSMHKELMELSGPYQAHKKEQIVKKALAKKIKANNLQRAKNMLKK